MSKFDDIAAALEEAEWCAKTEGRAYVLLAANNRGLIEVVPEEEKGHRKVLEVIRVSPKREAQWNERRGLE